MEKKVLGKGLEALIPKKLTMDRGQEVEYTFMDIQKIVPGKYQPREGIDKEELEELKKSIEQKGVLQPIIVRPIKGQSLFEIVAGNRRYEASKLLGKKEVPVIIKDLDDKETLLYAIVENLQRKDLNPIEEALSFKRLIDEFNFSLEDIAVHIGKDKSFVANMLRLLKLPEEIQNYLKKGEITYTQARTILSIENEELQKKFLEEILCHKLSVREIETKVRIFKKRGSLQDPFLSDIQERAQKRLGTKVRIYMKKGNKGKIVIEFYSLEDLERIIGRF